MRSLRGALLPLMAASVILSISFGIRSSLGLAIPEMRLDLAWPTSTFALAFAIQNLLWGFASPFAGALADRIGTFRTLALGAVIYTLGLVCMALASTPWMLHGSAGLLVGLGFGTTGFPIVLGALARAVPEDRRSLALGLGAAGGSFGQFLMPPVFQAFIGGFGWQGALFITAAMVVLLVPFGYLLGRRAAEPAETSDVAGSLREAFRNARGHGGYRLLNVGFFVCGFHVAFVSVHLPVFAQVCGLAPSVAAQSLALIGLFNMIGTSIAGALGDRFRKKWLLSAIYALRAVVILVFFLGPKTPTSFLVFSSVLGMLWLSTVPLTSGVVAQIFGTRYLASLFGVVMFSHQIGAFIGAYAGGLVFDLTGTYDLMWLSAAALGVFAAIVHAPIDDVPLARRLTSAPNPA
ncbi:MAG: MFS transporter [Geminicoccaceae bacterium]